MPVTQPMDPGRAAYSARAMPEGRASCPGRFAPDVRARDSSVNLVSHAARALTVENRVEDRQDVTLREEALVADAYFVLDCAAHSPHLLKWHRNYLSYGRREQDLMWPKRAHVPTRGFGVKPDELFDRQTGRTVRSLHTHQGGSIW